MWINRQRTENTAAALEFAFLLQIDNRSVKMFACHRIKFEGNTADLLRILLQPCGCSNDTRGGSPNTGNRDTQLRTDRYTELSQAARKMISNLANIVEQLRISYVENTKMLATQRPLTKCS